MKITAEFDTSTKTLTVTKDGAAAPDISDIHFYTSDYGPPSMSMYEKMEDGVYVSTCASKVNNISKVLGL